MERCFEVGVYGRSMFLIGIEATLKTQERLRVRWLGNSLEEALWEIKMLSPHVILFEIGDASQAGVATIMREYPSIKFMGLEPERDTVAVISSSEQPISSGEELAQVILQSIDGAKERRENS